MKTESVNLLQTILADSALAKKLAEMPADASTLTISLTAGPPLVSHPSWGDAISADNEPADDETIQLPTSGESTSAASEEFIPRRRVATLGDGQASDAEYKLVGKLGSGGTGIVYQAHQRAIDREVAVKSLRSELSSDPQQRARFLTEARVIGGLDHPNVIALHEVCMDDSGGLFYSMKRVDGSSWNHQIASMTIDENLRVLLRVADAIRYAHSRRLIHRDIKPENVMLGQFNEVLLADWGLAVSRDPHQRGVGSARATDSAIGGTPAYMAPELAIGDQAAVSFPTDIYLLGALLFQILSGYPPHDGDSLLACIHAAANNVIRPTDVEGEWMDIARKAMATRPADRYATVDDFMKAIEDQQVHQQSVRLVHRAKSRLAEATSEDGYEPFRVADALLRAAIETWPENRPAHEAISDLQRNFASVAANNGDLDLALSLYDACDEGDSEVAMRIRRARDQRNDYARGEAKYSVVFTQSPEAGLLTRLSDGEVVEANFAFLNLLGYPVEQIVGQRVPDLNVWACPQRRVEFVECVRKSGAVDNLETVFLHRDGHTIDVLISARTIALDDEKLLLATIRDISLRKQAETDLKRSRQRLSELQQLAGLGTWSYDVATGTIEWSDETFRLIGRKIDDGPLEFDQYLETLHPDDRSPLREIIVSSIKFGHAYELAIRQGTIGDVEQNVAVAERRYRPVIARGQPLTDENQQVVEVYGVLVPVRSLEIDELANRGDL